MNKKHRMYITKQVLALKMELKYETLDSSACRNCWLLYGSRKSANQGFYKMEHILDSNGVEKEIPKEAVPATNAEPGSDMDWLFEMLSIRSNPTKKVCKIRDELIPEPKPKQLTVGSDSGLVSRCMDALGSWRADDYTEWIRVGCILHAIDKENGINHWDKFSQQSDKYDHQYLCNTWDRFRDYDYTIGSLVFMAKEDNKDFVVHPKKSHVRLVNKKRVEKITIRNLVKQCRQKGIKGYSGKSMDELCDILNIPKQSQKNPCNKEYKKTNSSDFG